MRKKIFYSAYIISALMLLTLMIWQLILNYSKYHAVYLDYTYPLSIKYPIGYVVLIGMYWITTITVMFVLTLISIRKFNPDTKKCSLIIKSAIGISVFNISLGIYDIVSVISYAVAQFDASIFTKNTEGNRLFVMTTGGSVVWIAISVLPIIYVNLLKKNVDITQKKSRLLVAGLVVFEIYHVDILMSLIIRSINKFHQTYSPKFRLSLFNLGIIILVLAICISVTCLKSNQIKRKWLILLIIVGITCAAPIKLHKNVPYTSIYSTVANIFLEDVNLTHGKNQSFVSTVQNVNRFNKEAIKKGL